MRAGVTPKNYQRFHRLPERTLRVASQASVAAQALQPTTATLAQWPRAVALAQTFWQTAARDERLSAEFAAAAQANALHVAGL